MRDNLSRYTLRIEPELLEKFGYIAEYEGRTKNRELEQMIKRRIRESSKFAIFYSLNIIFDSYI